MIRNCNELQSSTTATSLRKREQYSKNGQSRRRSRSVRFKKKRHHVRQKSPEHVFEHGKHHVYEHEDDNAPENPDGEEAEGVFDQRMDLDDQQDYNDYSPNDRHRPHRHEHGVTDAHYHNRKTAAEKASFPIQGVIDQDNDDDDWQSSDQMDTEDVFSSADLTARYSSLMQETIQYGQELQAEFSGDPRREVKRALEDTFALIAYTDARQSSLAPLLEVAGRVPVAEELNGAILSKI